MNALAKIRGNARIMPHVRARLSVDLDDEHALGGGVDVAPLHRLLELPDGLVVDGRGPRVGGAVSAPTKELAGLERERRGVQQQRERERREQGARPF